MFFMDAQAELNIRNKAYRKALKTFIWDAYEQDMPKTDITTRFFLGRASRRIKAQIRSNQDGILAGIQEVEWLAGRLKIKLSKVRKDGGKIKKGDVILELEGKASGILSAERTILNVLQRMSGIATRTGKMACKLPRGVKLLATRKTLWGLIDKRAVALGNGGTHRLNLSDAILIKENHIKLSRNFRKSLKSSLRKLSRVPFVEIELESEDQINDFLGTYYSLKKIVKDRKGVVVMLDNFTPAQIKKFIKPLKQAGVAIEVSGGITEKNISRYNIAGVSAISSGAITMTAGHLDMNMQVLID